MDAFGNPLELPSHINPRQVLALVDQVLPFEVCLYHRVLPLKLEGDHLELGMVDPHDQVALDYVSKIAAYSDRTITPTSLAGHIHQVLLSAYLHHSSQPASEATAQTASPQTASTSAPIAAPPELSNADGPAQPPAKQPTPSPSQTPSESSFSYEDTTIIEGGLAALHQQANEEQQTATANDEDEAASAYSDPTLLEQPSAAEFETLFPQLDDERSNDKPDPQDNPSTNSTARSKTTESAPLNSTTEAVGQASMQQNLSELPLHAAMTLKVEQPTHVETQHPNQERAQAIALRQQEQDELADMTHRRTLVLDETEVMAELAKQAEMPQSQGQTATTERENPIGLSNAGLSKDIVEDATPRDSSPSSMDIVPANLNVLASHPISQQPWEAIARLPAKAILQAVISRMLQGDITRLRLERCRRPQAGMGLAQLLWNPTGVMQTAWDGFPLGAFGSLARALRQLAQIPMGAILQPIQRGVMRRYQGQPLLLLIQFLPGRTTAAIELRLLHGQALSTFQQRQQQDLDREALLTAQTLQYQVQQILDHIHHSQRTKNISPQLIQVIERLHHTVASEAAPSDVSELSPMEEQSPIASPPSRMMDNKALVIPTPHSIMSTPEIESRLNQGLVE